MKTATNNGNMDSNNQMNSSTYESIEGCIGKRLDEIEHKASAIIDARWQQVLHHERQNAGWENRSRLSLRCYRNGGNLRLEWSGVKWKKQKDGKPLRIRVYIKKGSNHNYPYTRLLPFMAEWEKSIVEEVEEELSLIRREAFHLNRALISIRYAWKVALK